jgi:hypothetical protein
MSSTEKLVESILAEDLNQAAENLSESFVEILRNKLIEAKKIVAAKYGVAELAEALDDIENGEQIDEANIVRMGRLKMIRARIRGGKVQRRVRKSGVPGMRLSGGKLVRMTPSEKRKRKIGARRAKIKRRAKMARALMKRRRSIAKRKALGLK